VPHPASPSPVILWFRKDLRLDDNLALSAAVDSGRPVLPIYIREPDAAETGPLGAAQAWWLHHSLVALSQSIESKGSTLVLLSGTADDVLAKLIEQTGADTVFWNRRHDTRGIAVDTAIKQQLKARGIEARSFAGQLLHDPAKLKTGSGGPYRVYTPFWRAIEKNEEPAPPIGAPEKLAPLKQWPASEPLDSWNLLPTKPDWAATFSEIWTPGETAAHEKLQDFIDEAISGYKQGRDFPAQNSTSLLSPHLAMGEISPARVWDATRGLSARIDPGEISHFRKELVWRDFCYHLMYHFPELASKNWNAKFDAFAWHTDDGHFKAWTQGMTGYPIVDAGMRQLWRHGFMHNRIRMVTASFLIKHLLIDWREGERWFRDTLVDADPAANAGNWQWVAGSGADASPFFRIFNPMLQGERFDPDGTYVREFVPELKDMDSAFIHRPFEAPEKVLKAAGVVLGKTYPKPIVEHRGARDRALAAYKALKEE
jgi:deoxyribodipyrimidine photo-lyase